MLVAIGLNQRCATVADREVVAHAPERLPADLAAYAGLDGVDEVAVLSTCYRVELYATTDRPEAALAALRLALERRAGRAVPLQERVGAEAFRHLARVAASLESAVLGEPQILGQVKEAFRRASAAGTAGGALAGVLAGALLAAKRGRTETALGRAGVSWGHAATVLAEKVLGPVAGRRVVVIGAGELARLTAQHLREQRAVIVVLNRTPEHAQALAAEVGGEARPIEALADELLRADVLVSAAPAVPAELAPAALARTMRARRRRLVLVDLAVPRAISAGVGELADVYLCDVDDLDRVMKAAVALRSSAAERAERIVEEEVARRSRDEAERRAAPIIRELRSQAEAIAHQEVERTLQRLGEDPELGRRLEAMSRAIVAKLLHAPSARLREAIRDHGTDDALVAAAIQIFGLSGPAPAPAAASTRTRGAA